MRLDFFGDTLEIDPQLRSGNAAHDRASCARSISCRWRNSSSRPTPSACSAPAMSRRSARPARRHALRGGQRGPPHRRHGALAAAVPRAARNAVRLPRRTRRSRSSRSPRKRPTSASRRSPTTIRRARTRSIRRGGGAPYKPLPPDRLYLSRRRMARPARAHRRWRGCRRSPRPRAPPTRSMIGAHAGRNFVAERSEPGSNVFEAVKPHVEGAAGGRQARRHRAVERGLARAHGPCARRARARSISRRSRPGRRRSRCRGRRSRSPCSASSTASRPPMSPSSASRTFWATAWCARAGSRSGAENFIAEVDEPLRRRPRRPCRSRHRPLRRPARHRGGGRAARLPGDPLCRRRQAVPAGREHRASVALRLGGGRRRARPARRAAWQARKARMKNRIREMAGELIKIAAERQLREAPQLARRHRALRRILRRAFPTRRPTTSRPPSPRCSTILPPAGRWIG